MKKLLAAIVVVFALAGTASATSPESHFNRTVYLVTDSKRFSSAELADELPALQAGLEEFERYWGGSIRLVQTDAVPYRAWGITITDKSDCMACLGYHDLARGVPYARVFPDPAYVTSVTLTHELFEMVADPYINRAALAGSTFYLVEPADPVEDDSFAFTRPSATGKPVKVSDFPTQLWYRKGLKAGKFDFTNHVTHSLQVLKNGYVSWWAGTGWTQTFGRHVAIMRAYKQRK